MPPHTFFLFGPRGCGKSTWVRQSARPQVTLDLLKQSLFIELQRNPSLIESKVGALSPGDWVFIDEIQKIPQLLDEVHRLSEEKRLQFILTGSSARKLKRDGANLLGGRAQTRKMYPFSTKELAGKFDIPFLMHWGTLPVALAHPEEVKENLSSYLETYLREEIKEEALVRKVEVFSRFLEVAGQLNGQVLNFENISRDAGKSGVTIQNWYQILEETLMGSRLFPLRPGFKVREVGHPKFYWFDCGVARAAAGLLGEEVDSVMLGYAFETLVLNEMKIYNEISRKGREIFYYGTPGEGEIDFVISTRKKTLQSSGEFITVEVKSSKKWKRSFEDQSRSFAALSKGTCRAMYGVYLGEEILKFDQFTVYPFNQFVENLFKGLIF